MAKEATESQVKQETRTVQITASMGLWAAFDRFMSIEGCQKLPEGLRVAMRKVTGFNGQSQGNSPD